MVKYYIKIIVEGDEEETFFEIVKEEGVNEKIWLGESIFIVFVPL